jgi:pimeloyl-ACP methyl ester carboxylesterase
MADFVLVHGGLHGAACWDLLRPELEQRGHRTFAMDLPIDRPGIYMEGYADAALDAVAGKAADDAFLVGHSMGGMVIPHMLKARPAAKLILLCAGFGHTTEEERLEGLAATTRDFFAWLITDAKGRVTMSRENAIMAFYPDVEPKIADWAVSKLRPQWAEAFSKIGPVAPYGDKVAQVIYTLGDRIIDPELHRKMAENRFGITPVPLPGGHSPFLSHPAKLAEVLSEAAQ